MAQNWQKIVSSVCFVVLLWVIIIPWSAVHQNVLWTFWREALVEGELLRAQKHAKACFYNSVRCSPLPQSLRQIGLQIPNIFDADRQAHQTIRDTIGFAYIFGD